MSGVKHDAGKARVELVDASFVEGLGRVLAFGARKYGDHNWRGGINVLRIIGAAMRHLLAVVRGEDIDPESGEHHSLHLGCNAMFLYVMLTTRPDLDDRYKENNNGGNQS